MSRENHKDAITFRCKDGVKEKLKKLADLNNMRFSEVLRMICNVATKDIQ